MNKLIKNLKSREGFTLVELIVVIAVLGTLAGIAVPRITGVQDKAVYASGKALLANLKTPLELYRVENGDYPNTDDTDDDGSTSLNDAIEDYLDNVDNLLPDSSSDDWNLVSYTYNNGSYSLIIEHPDVDQTMELTPNDISKVD